MSLPGWLIIALAACGTAFGQAGYIDSATCAGCHREIAASYAETGMARSFRTLTPETRLPEFNGERFQHEPSRQLFTALRRNGRFVLRREAAGTVAVEKEAHYIFGSGNHARSYLTRSASGRLYELPLTWYTEKGGYWAMSPAYDRPDHPGFTREIPDECMFCHNAYPAGANGGIFPEQLPQGIDCQRCHGPGAKHVEAAGKGVRAEEIRAAIVNPARLERARQMEVCMQCHLETTSLKLPAAIRHPERDVYSYRPGEALGEYAVHFMGAGQEKHFDFVSAVYRLRQSACFQKSAMTCTTCHNPHQVRRGQAAAQAFERTCRSCHTDLSRNDSHRAGSDCARCHMPKRRPEDVIHVTATDHYIRARPEPEPDHAAPERQDENTAPYRGPVRLYYPETLPGNELLPALAQIQHGANVTEGLAQVERFLARTQPARSEPYFEYAEALRKAGLRQRAVTEYERATARQPQRWTHYYGFALALLEMGQPTRAGEMLRLGLRLAPNQARIWFALGDALAAEEKNNDAADAYHRAVEMDPELAEARNNLGTLLLKLGRDAEGEAALREAVRVRPDLTTARVNLAGVLLRRKRPAESAEQLQEAIRTGTPLLGMPGLAESAKARAAELARAHLSLGIAYRQLRDRRAEEQFRKAIALSEDAEVKQLAEELLKAGQ